MSELKTNKISTNDQNNVAIDNALGLKSYDTTGRDALTSVAGDMIYNTTTTKLEFYNGSAWVETGGADVVQVEYLLVGGAGGGGSGRNNANNGNGGGGGGAGGLITNVSGSNSGGGNAANPAYYVVPSTNFTVTVGAGGPRGPGAYTVSPSGEKAGTPGNRSQFGTLRVRGGGGGGGRNGAAAGFDSMTSGKSGGSGGSGGSGDSEQGYNGGTAFSNYKYGGGGGAGAVGVAYNVNGKDGGVGVTTTIITTAEATTASVGQVSGSDVYFASGGGGSIGWNSTGNAGSSPNGGGGAGAVGQDGGNPNGGAGGTGVSVSITGAAVTYAGGGGAGGSGDLGLGPGAGGTGGGGAGSLRQVNATPGTTNTGGGGGGLGGQTNSGLGYSSGTGGSGIVIVRYPNTYTITVGAGLTSSTTTDGSDKITSFTAGSDTVSFS